MAAAVVPNASFELVESAAYRLWWAVISFFFVMLITPKITTANRLKSAITSNTVMLSPP